MTPAEEALHIKGREEVWEQVQAEKGSLVREFVPPTDFGKMVAKRVRSMKSKSSGGGLSHNQLCGVANGA